MPRTDSNVTSSNSCRAKNYRWLPSPARVSASLLSPLFSSFLIYMLFCLVASSLPLSTFKRPAFKRLSSFALFLPEQNRYKNHNDGCHVCCFSVTSDFLEEGGRIRRETPLKQPIYFEKNVLSDYITHQTKQHDKLPTKHNSKTDSNNTE